VKRAEFTGVRGFANISEYKARPSWFAPRMSMRPLRTIAGVVIESSSR
jgi:hypothetical protein